jgi:hypothetical protein
MGGLAFIGSQCPDAEVRHALLRAIERTSESKGHQQKSVWRTRGKNGTDFKPTTLAFVATKEHRSGKRK